MTVPAKGPKIRPILLIILALTVGPWFSAIGRAGPLAAGCPVFPEDNVWNAPIDHLPVDAHSSGYVETIGADIHLTADFGSGDWPPGSGAGMGIPYQVVSGEMKKVVVRFRWEDESDPGPYPIPDKPLIEGGPRSDGDRHVILLDKDHCLLYELYKARPDPRGPWLADSGAVFDLRSNQLRPDGRTSADAAGLPIFPGLVRYEEILAGEIRHAIRFTSPQTRAAKVWPARHFASTVHDERYPPMGQRFRLKKDFNLRGYSYQTLVILRAMMKYGIILADNGSAWFLSGAPDPRWNNVQLRELRRVLGRDLEAVDTRSLMVTPDSGLVRR